MKRVDSQWAGINQGILITGAVTMFRQGCMGKEEYKNSLDRWRLSDTATMYIALIMGAIAIVWLIRNLRRAIRTDRIDYTDKPPSSRRRSPRPGGAGKPDCPDGLSSTIGNKTILGNGSDIDVRFLDDADTTTQRPITDPDMVCSECWTIHHPSKGCPCDPNK